MAGAERDVAGTWLGRALARLVLDGDAATLLRPFVWWLRGRHPARLWPPPAVHADAGALRRYAIEAATLRARAAQRAGRVAAGPAAYLAAFGEERRAQAVVLAALLEAAGLATEDT